VEGRGRPRRYGPRVKTQVQLRREVAEQLRAWARRHEVSVSAALDTALARGLPSPAAPAAVGREDLEVVQVRLPVARRDAAVAEAARWGCSYSLVVEAAVLRLVAATGGLADFRLG
jgi:hypothetical protein